MASSNKYYVKGLIITLLSLTLGKLACPLAAAIRLEDGYFTRAL